MLSPMQVEEVRALLASGERSQRKIALLTGVSRGSVANIAAGRRRERPQFVDDRRGPNRGPIGRCPGCGGRVHLPCRLCRLRNTAPDSRSERRRFDPTVGR